MTDEEDSTSEPDNRGSRDGEAEQGRCPPICRASASSEEAEREVSGQTVTPSQTLAKDSHTSWHESLSQLAALKRHNGLATLFVILLALMWAGFFALWWTSNIPVMPFKSLPARRELSAAEGLERQRTRQLEEQILRLRTRLSNLRSHESSVHTEKGRQPAVIATPTARRARLPAHQVRDSPGWLLRLTPSCLPGAHTETPTLRTGTLARSRTSHSRARARGDEIVAGAELGGWPRGRYPVMWRPEHLAAAGWRRAARKIRLQRLATRRHCYGRSGRGAARWIGLWMVTARLPLARPPSSRPDATPAPTRPPLGPQVRPTHTCLFHPPARSPLPHPPPRLLRAPPTLFR